MEEEFFYIVSWDTKKEKFSVEPYNDLGSLKRIEKEEYLRVLNGIERRLWIK